MQDLKRIRRNLATRKTKRGSEVNSTEPSLWGFQIRKPTLLTRVFPAMFTGFYFLSIYYAMITLLITTTCDPATVNFLGASLPGL